MLTRRWHNGTCQGECGPSQDQNSAWLLACSQVAAANTIPMKHAAMQDSSKTSCTSRLIILAPCPLMIRPRRLAEFRPFESGLAEVRPTEVRPAEVRTTQVRHSNIKLRGVPP